MKLRKCCLNFLAVLPIVFIPGLKGSRLIDGQNKIRWVTPLQVLGIGGEGLALPLKFTEQGLQSHDDLKSLDVLEDVTFIPKIASEQVYGPFLERAKSWGRPFYTFSYDWRRDNLETVSAFKKFIDHVKEENHVAQVDVIAHSMGGLITMSLLTQDSGSFRNVIFAGVPFNGGIGFLEDMHAGTKTGLNAKVLSPEVLGTFPSVYSLLSDAPCPCLNDAKGPIEMDFFSARDWQVNQLGLMSIEGRDHTADLEFLKKALPRAREFRKSLFSKTKTDYPKLLVILGHSFPTLIKALKYGPQAVKNWDFKTLPSIPGDGRVGANNVPPDGIPFDLYYSEMGHSALLNDPKMLTIIESRVLQK